MKYIVILITFLIAACATNNSLDSEKSDTLKNINVPSTSNCPLDSVDPIPSREELDKARLECGSNQSCRQEIQRQICELYGCLQPQQDNNQQQKSEKTN